tara:strand:+ start:932 stop:2071 length:1140 start_codon:yes stop_codon:yes gene_type:complete
MAILDRPMFQRRLPTEQLRMYGIPAFANGGVVQKFNKGSGSEGVTIPPGYQYDDKALRQTKDSRTVMETITDPESYTPMVEKYAKKGVKNLEGRIAALERIIANPDFYGEDKAAEAQAELPKLKAELAEKKATTGSEEQKIEATSTPVPKEIQDAENPDQLREAILKQEGPGQDIKLPEKQENDDDPLGPEKDKLSALEAMVRERSDLYKQILGDPKEGLKQQGLLQLAQFGLNLASAKGGSFAEKIAKSAKDPLQTFAALGREAMKDERAIDMLAIKGAEDEMARTQKVGNFGQLVQDFVNEGFSREKALEKAEEVFAQKSGKTVGELRAERYTEYLRFYEAELGAGDEAREKANDAIEQEFGTPMFTSEEPEVKRAT